MTAERTVDADPPLPPVERVRPGLWSIPVPIPNNPLRYVLVYAFETDRGPYLIDAGWNTDDAYAKLVEGLDEAGFAIDDVQGVLVTHIHPDHYGLAGRIREASGAWIGLHPADAALIEDRYEEPADLIQKLGAMLRRDGAPAEEIATLQNASMPVRPWVTTAIPDRLIEDGDKADIPGWDLTAIWTPGHSPGHICLYEAGNRLMLAGDHVLPRITPNISFHPQAGPDPLGDFLNSLDKVAAYDTVEALPAHEHRFTDLPGRVAELKGHHHARFDEVVAAIQEGHTSAWSIAGQMTWSRPWEQIQGWMRRAAAGETLAHLRYLEKRGVLAEQEGEPSVWSLVDIASRA
ncbi:MAG TPA: MBL fold metallo-hydrolase [Acidimicrobiales bacterium]|jgi:glyoxylase-like metal-dependent hydrolase (beta-lactamase superfamily II)|nr:MBL fold metallo-hydrolase [Acidimicrobiales bacterium]